MARRYRRYRRYRRTYYRRKKWTAYTSEVVVNDNNTITSGNFKELVTIGVYGSNVSLNGSAYAQSPVASINYYVCRARFKGVVAGQIPPGVNYVVYIAYIPYAVQVDASARGNDNLLSSYFYSHPEYVLAWTRIDNINNSGDTGEVSLYSRITKKLASGDRIMIGVLGKNNSANDYASPAGVQGTFSCYLRTN